MKTFLEAQTEAIEQGKNITRKIDWMTEKLELIELQNPRRMRLRCVDCGHVFFPDIEQQKQKVWGVA